MPKKVTAILVTGKRFPDSKGHDRAEDDRDKFIAVLSAEPAFKDADIRGWAWDGNPVNLDAIDSPAILLVGYSFGGNTVLTWAENAKQRFVDMMILLDPVNPAAFLVAFPPFEVPPMVRRADCYTRAGFHIPFPASRKIHTTRPNLANHDLDEAHENFYRNKTVQGVVRTALKELLDSNFIPWNHPA